MKFSRLLFITAAFLIVWSFLNPQNSNIPTDDVILELEENLSLGKDATVIIKNNSDSAISLPANCPKNPLLVEEYLNGEWQVLEAENSNYNCDKQITSVDAGKTVTISFAPWNREMLHELGRYRISLVTTLDDKEKIYSKEVIIKKPGIIKQAWNELFYRPILNTLIYLISNVPGHSLGWGIILLTLLTKIILLVPNHKALKAQKQMQKVQPQLDALKKKYEKDPQKLAAETMLIWKKYKVNPMSSCLPMLIQFPVLIGLFYVVKGGLSYIHPALLYTSLKAFDPSMIEPVFMGIFDLTQISVIVLPISIGLLQFGQMRLTLGKTLKANSGEKSQAPMMNQTMMYAMPIMIAVFTATMPAVVGFYWGTSTVFGIGQQIIVNRSKD